MQPPFNLDKATEPDRGRNLSKPALGDSTRAPAYYKVIEPDPRLAAHHVEFSGLFCPHQESYMELYLSKRKTLSVVLVTLVLSGLAHFLAGLSGRTLPELTGIGSGRSVALASAKAFYSIDYQDGVDVWAARLCAVSTQPACKFYQSVVAPFLWLEFAHYHSQIVAETGKASLLSQETAGSRADAPMQVWQVTITQMSSFTTLAVIVHGNKASLKRISNLKWRC
jgi:hypothetical protein